MSERQLIKQEIKYLGNECMKVLKENWETAEGHFNEGQQALYRRYVMDAIQEWVDEAKEFWPWVSSEHYEANVFMCYDGDVIEQCFYVTIHDPVPEMDELIRTAQELAAYLEFLGLLKNG